MAGISGWVGIGSASRLTATAALLTRFDGSQAERLASDGSALIVAGRPGERSVGREGEWLAATWGDLRFADPGLADVASGQGCATALIRGYLDRGTKILEGIRGAFALALSHSSGRELLVATDRLGIRPIMYTSTAADLSFGSSADALRLSPEWDAAIEQQAVYDYAHFHVIPGPETIYRDVRRLLPGEFLHVRDGRLTIERYWKIRFIEDEDQGFDKLRESFLATLETSVGRSMKHAPSGCFLSGGTDSSTVSGMVGRVTGTPAATFSIGFDEPGYDELGFARIAARHFNTDHHEYYVTPQDIVDAIPRIADIHDQPFGNSSAVPAYFCARMARDHGISVLLAGDGGDELFGGNERYATQYLFSLYEHLPRTLRTAVIDPLARHAPEAIAPARWFKRFVSIASTPMPDRLDTYNLLDTLGPSAVFAPEFLAHVDTTRPLLLMREAYGDCTANSLINRMLALDLRITLADNDLPKVTRACELAGVNAEFPLLDDDVVDLSAHLVPRMKLRGTRLRYFFKEALKGFLPEEILRKKKHGFGLPFGRWLPRHAPLLELVGDSLSSLRHRGIIQAAFLDSLLSERLQEHASYFGTMAWVLTMLEQWYQRRAVPAQALNPLLSDSSERQTLTSPSV